MKKIIIRIRETEMSGGFGINSIWVGNDFYSEVVLATNRIPPIRTGTVGYEFLEGLLDDVYLQIRDVEKSMESLSGSPLSSTHVFTKNRELFEELQKLNTLRTFLFRAKSLYCSHHSLVSIKDSEPGDNTYIIYIAMDKDCEILWR